MAVACLRVVALMALVAALQGPLPATAQGLQSPIVDWLNMMQSHVRLTNPVTHQQAAKWYAGLSLSIYRALVAHKAADGAADVDKYVVAYAAHTYLDQIYPAYAFQHDKLIGAQVAAATPAQRKWASRIGEDATNKLVTSRVKDGFSKYVDMKLPDPAPGVYRFTPNQTFLMYPQMGYMTPYILTLAQCKSITAKYVKRGKAYYGTNQYYDEGKYVRDWGNTTSDMRTGYDADTPMFWNDGAGTSTAGGHLLNVSYQIVPNSWSLIDQAQFFAAFTVVLSDACIPCFKVKYDALVWRPWTAMMTGDKTNKLPVDPNWKPFLPQPPHPSYPSGHSCIAGAATRLLAKWFGSDTPANPIELASEGLPTAGVRKYPTFSSISMESGRSRVLGGLHYKNDCDDGLKLAADVADVVYTYFKK